VKRFRSIRKQVKSRYRRPCAAFSLPHELAQELR
jgi:hypothetical protein